MVKLLGIKIDGVDFEDVSGELKIERKMADHMVTPIVAATLELCCEYGAAPRMRAIVGIFDNYRKAFQKSPTFTVEGVEAERPWMTHRGTFDLTGYEVGSMGATISMVAAGDVESVSDMHKMPQVGLSLTMIEAVSLVGFLGMVPKGRNVVDLQNKIALAYASAERGEKKLN